MRNQFNMTPGAWALTRESGSHCAGPGTQQMQADAAALNSWESSLDSELEHKFTKTSLHTDAKNLLDGNGT